MSNKRKSDAQGGDSHQEKVARYDECVGDWSTRPGMIIEVKMRNFMCHQVSLNDPEILIKCLMVSQMFFLAAKTQLNKS